MGGAALRLGGPFPSESFGPMQCEQRLEDRRFSCERRGSAVDRRGGDGERAARAASAVSADGVSTYLNISWAARAVYDGGRRPRTSAAIVFTALCSFIISAALSSAKAPSAPLRNQNFAGARFIANKGARRAKRSSFSTATMAAAAARAVSVSLISSLTQPHNRKAAASLGTQARVMHPAAVLVHRVPPLAAMRPTQSGALFNTRSAHASNSISPSVGD